MCRYHWIGRACPRILLTLYLWLGWSGGPWVWSAAAPTPASGASEVEQARRLFDALAESERQAPADRFDPDAIVKSAGGDPTALFNWVRDHTDWAPYQGALRGPVGVLMDRIGSSLDRALLLADLLRRAGHEARLVHKNLSASDAGELLGKVRPMTRSVAPPGELPDRKQFEALAEKFGVDAKELRARAMGAAAEADRVAEDAIGRAAEVLPAVVAAVGDPPAGATDQRDKASALAAMQDSWWVQMKQGDHWLDLDPLLPDAAPGRASTATAGSNPIDPAKLDPAQWHQLTVRVVIEKDQAGKLSRQTVFSHDLVPARVLGQHIVLRQMPLNWPGKMPADAAEWKQALAGQREWMPQLQVDRQTFSAASFDEDGGINLHPNPNPMASLGHTIGRVGGALDNAFGKEEQAPAAALSGEWIEYEVRRPGAAPRTIRREILDRLGPAARAAAAVAPALPWTDPQRIAAAGRMLDEIEIVPQVCKLAPQFVSHVAVSATLANRDAILDLLGHQPGEPDIKKVSALSPLPGAAFALAVQRDLMDREAAADVYYDSINVLTHHSFLRFNGDAINGCSGFDIVLNEPAVRPGAAGAFKIRLARGVMETLLEASLASAVGKPGGTVENAALAYAKDLGEAQPWLTVRRPDDDSWRRAALPADAKSRIEEDLKAGYVIIAPAKTPADGKVGWWRIDPVTGQTLGLAGSGWGMSMGEYATLITQILSNALCVSQYHSTPGILLCVVVGTGGSIGVAAGGAVLKDVLLYIVLTIFGHIANHYG